MRVCPRALAPPPPRESPRPRPNPRTHVEDEEIPRGALPPPVLVQKEYTGYGVFWGRSPSFANPGLGKADLFWMGS
jgi:hypothetical protein